MAFKVPRGAKWGHRFLAVWVVSAIFLDLNDPDIAAWITIIGVLWTGFYIDAFIQTLLRRRRNKK